MKKFSVILGIVLYMNIIQATDYYLSMDGNDNHNGTSEDQAWASIQKLNTVILSLKPGDQVFFQRGGIYEGTINIQNILGSEAKPINIGAYGVGDNPIISGTMAVGGWSREGNIWTSHCQDCLNETDMLFIDEKSQPLGRYPNETSLRSSGGSGKNMIHDPDLSFEDNFWQGGQVVISTQTWVKDAVRIFSQIGKTITLAEGTSYEISGDQDYFIQNHYNSLDREGEWAYNNTDKEIYIYSASDIQEAEVSVAHQAACIKITNGRYINIENLSLTGSRFSAVKIEYSKNVNFSNNTISNNARLAVHLDHCDFIKVDNNYIKNTLDTGIGAWDSDFCQITNNHIENTATIPGRGENGTAKYSGIIVSRGSGNVIEYNKVFHTGYNAITFYEQANVLIKNNYVNDYCTVLTDGGGIYTWQSKSPGNRILGNIILNSKEDLGIYIDEESENIVIDGNTAAFNMSGIFIHNSRSVKVFNNLVFNNHESQFIIVRHGETLIDYMEVKNNQIFTMGKPKQYSFRARFVNGGNNVFENNCWADPFKKKLLNSESSVWGTKVYTVPEWQSLGFFTDRAIPRTFAESGLADTTGYVKFYINPSKSVKTLDLPGTYRDLDERIYVGAVQLEPYSSIVLLAEERD